MWSVCVQGRLVAGSEGLAGAGGMGDMGLDRWTRQSPRSKPGLGDVVEGEPGKEGGGHLCAPVWPRGWWALLATATPHLQARRRDCPLNSSGLLRRWRLVGTGKSHGGGSPCCVPQPPRT